MVLACEMSIPGGGGVEDDMTFIARAVLVFVAQFLPRSLLFLLFGGV